MIEPPYGRPGTSSFSELLEWTKDGSAFYDTMYSDLEWLADKIAGEDFHEGRCNALLVLVRILSEATGESRDALKASLYDYIYSRMTNIQAQAKKHVEQLFKNELGETPERKRKKEGRA